MDQNQNQYQNQQQYQNPYPKPQKPDVIGFGLASMIIGIIAVCLFLFCINIVLAVVSIVLGIVQLCTARRKGMAVTGILLSFISVILTGVFWFLVMRQGDYFYENQNPFAIYEESGIWNEF